MSAIAKVVAFIVPGQINRRAEPLLFGRDVLAVNPLDHRASRPRSSAVEATRTSAIAK